MKKKSIFFLSSIERKVSILQCVSLTTTRKRSPMNLTSSSYTAPIRYSYLHQFTYSLFLTTSISHKPLPLLTWIVLYHALLYYSLLKVLKLLLLYFSSTFLLHIIVVISDISFSCCCLRILYNNSKRLCDITLGNM